MTKLEWVRRFRNLSGLGLVDSCKAYDKWGFQMTPEQTWESCGGKIPKSVAELEDEIANALRIIRLLLDLLDIKEPCHNPPQEWCSTCQALKLLQGDTNA